MKQGKLFSAIILTAGIFSACSSNSSGSTGDKKTSDNARASSKGGSGSGMYYQMSTTTNGKCMHLSSVMKLFIAADGKVRMEMTSAGLPGKAGELPLVVIGYGNNPHESTTIDDASKTYTLNHISDDDLKPDGDLKSSPAVKIGEEKVDGYNCVHAQVITDKSMKYLGKMMDTVDIWRSTDVPIPVNFKKWLDDFETKSGNAMYSIKTVGELKQMGCTGMPVRTVLRGTGTNLKMDLVKAQQQDFPESMFKVPAGYKEIKE